jgi:hypothetical protein
MNRVILVFAVVLSALCAFAQDTQASAGDSLAGDFSPRTFRGCLSQSGDHYDLLVDGVTPRQYHLAGTNLAQLDGKAGHMVSITGTVPNTMPVGANMNAENDTINFLAVDDLATACNSAQGPAGETPYSRAAALASAENQYLRPSGNFLSESDLRAQPGSFMVVPLVGALALGLLQVARYRRRR